MAVKRFDVGEFSKPVRLDNGYLRTSAKITRTGIFTYRIPDGTSRRELRPASEVFHVDALVSFGLVALTNDHPPEMLNAKNTKKYQVGTVANVRQDGAFIAADVLITDERAIEDAEQGKTELSCGYSCDLDMTPGVMDGQHYDAVQKNIRGNHVALVTRGRAGAEAALHLDKDDNETQEKEHMKTVKIDGVDFEMSEQAAQAFAKVQAEAEKKSAEHLATITTLKVDVEKQKARADKAEEELAAEKKARTDATAPETIGKVINLRLALLRTAEKIVNDKAVKLDEMTDEAIHKAVIIKVFPAAKLDGADPAYVQARFDSAVETFEASEKTKPNAGLAGVREAAGSRSDSNVVDAGEARKRMVANSGSEWKPKSA